MQVHEFERYVKSARDYKFARMFSILLITFTIISCILSFFTMESIYTLYLANSFFVIGFAYLLNEPSSVLLFILFIVLTIGLITTFIIFYKKSKTSRVGLLILLILVSIDTAVLLINCLTYITRYLNLVLHGLTIFQLAKAYKTSKCLDDDFEEGVILTEADITEIYNFLRTQKANDN